MKHQVTLHPGGTVVEVDDQATLDEVKAKVPAFFGVRHGKDERHGMYRGFVIVRHTVTFTGCRPERKTVVYLYTRSLEGKPDTFCVSAGSDVSTRRQARRLADYILASGRYEYGMDCHPAGTPRRTHEQDP